jgi:hypothetical protein
MPALYRMPVVYLVVLVVAAAVGIGAWARSLGPVQGGQAASIAPVKPVSEPSPTTGESSPAAPDDGILRTAEGLRRKVVVKDLDVVCRSEPVGGVPVGSPLDYFSIRFVFGEAPPGRPTMIQVGPSEGPAQGWVPESSVQEWDTRLMARPTRRAGRPALAIYREEACLLDVLAARVCPRHKGRCPTEGEESESKTAGSASTSTLGMPILQSRAIPEPDGSTRTIFEVASLVRDRGPSAPAPAAPPADFLPALRRVEIAFVIDTTASMQQTIDAARRVAARLAEDASKRDIALRLGLVEYRDDAPIFGFVARVVTRFTDPAGFREALGRIEAARRGDGSLDEAVLDGLAVALPAVSSERPVRDHLNWSSGRMGELATRMIVLLGDAPDHARDLARVRRLAEQARKAGIMIATVELDRPGQLSHDESTRYRAQWKTLAEESFRPLDKASGFSRPVAPAALRADEAGRLAPMLQSLIDDRVEHARTIAAMAAAEAEGKLVDYVNSQGLTLDQVAPVLVDLHRGETDARTRPDPRSGGRKAPSVRRGWIAESRGGATLVTVEVLMSRAELGVLIDELTQLQQALQGTSRDLSDLLRIGTAAASGETGFLAADRGSQTFADHLRRRQGLPPARPDSLLRRTQSDLLQADDLYRAALDARLGSSLAELIRRRNAPDWDDPRRTIDGMATVPYALIDF